ncbi:MAG: transporter substrate-binding domain-containing protein [Colwellia sp.]|nr:transporter substrate-binding domain-containing protein [Colwellia sp.]
MNFIKLFGMMMNYLLSVLLVFILFCHVTMVQAKNLTVAIFIEPPFADLVDGEFVGENIDIVKALSKSVDLTPIFIRCPFIRCLALVKHGKADMIMGLRKLVDREKDLIFLSPPYMVQHYPLRFFTLTSQEIAINSFADLNNLTVGMLRGASYFDLFDDDKVIKKVELTSRTQLINMLLRGRIDVFIEREESVLPHLPLEQYLQKFTLAKYQYDQSENAYIAISKHSHIKEYAERLSAHLKTLVTNGTIKAIRMK